jgi:hypothetical protein
MLVEVELIMIYYSKIRTFSVFRIANDSNLHLCLDNVYYPLDYTKLGINTLTVPIGLKFSLSDGIFTQIESIRYTSEAKYYFS